MQDKEEGFSIYMIDDRYILVWYTYTMFAR